MRNKYTTCGIATLFLILSVVACTEVDFETATSTKPKANFDLTWPEDATASQPDSLLIIASRTINSWRSAMKVAKTSGNGSLLFPLEPVTSTTNEAGEETTTDPNTEIDNWTKWPLRKGNFEFVATTLNSEAFTVSNLDELADDMKTTVGDVLTSYRLYPIDHAKILPAGQTWRDLNEYIDRDIYIDANAGGLFTLHNSNVDIKLNKTNQVELEGRQISQHVSITFKLKVERNVSISNILSELAGIPVSIFPATGGFLTDKTCKVIITPQITERVAISEIATVDNEGTPYTAELDLVTVQADVDVISLIRNTNNRAVTGAGIFTVALTCNYTDGSGATQNPTYYGVINLYNTLGRQQATQQIGSKNGVGIYKNTSTALELVIDDAMTITTLGVVNQNTGSNNHLDTWTISDSITLEL